MNRDLTALCRAPGTMAETGETLDLAKSLEHAHNEIEKLKAALDKALINDADFDRRISLLEAENAEIRSYAEDLKTIF